MNPAVSAFLSSAPACGFSGSRSAAPPAALVAAVAAALPPSCRCFVGCAPGADAAFRAALPAASVLSASAFGAGRSSFARRSAACVGAVAACGPGSLWLSFPASPCPPGLLPSSSSSRCFSGSGSGSWASLALAAGSGLSCLLWLPPGLSAPPSWGFASLGRGWWLALPSGSQLGLF